MLHLEIPQRRVGGETEDPRTTVVGVGGGGEGDMMLPYGLSNFQGGGAILSRLHWYKY